MKTAITSNQLNELATDAMSLVNDLQAAQRSLDAVHERIKDYGLDLKMGDNETELAFLRRIAVHATEAEHDALKREAVAQVQSETSDQVQFSVRRPRSFLGRTFSKLARAVG